MSGAELGDSSVLGRELVGGVSKGITGDSSVLEPSVLALCDGDGVWEVSPRRRIGSRGG